MFITKNTLSELVFYLEALKTILTADNIKKPLFPDGVTIGRVAYHTGESANFWLLVFILKKDYPRDRDSEFVKSHTLSHITNSLDRAIKLCQEIVRRKISIVEKLPKPREVYSMGFAVNNFYEILLHVTAHTAEHLGHIKAKIGS